MAIDKSINTYKNFRPRFKKSYLILCGIYS